MIVLRAVVMCFVFFFKQKTAYEMRISDWSSDVALPICALAARLAAQGGAALVVDYGYDGPALGDTLQAVRGHGYVNPFEAPGEHDLTAHVDFGTLGRSGERRVGKEVVRTCRSRCAA